MFGSFYLLIASFFIGVNMNSFEGLLSSMYVGAFEMAVPFIFFSLALRKTNNPTLINQLCYLSPFISLFIIHIVLKENIYMTTYIGLFLIVLGIVFNEYLAERIKKKKYY
jgi:drug/metabolite transporter (DMT)-like permease